MTSGKRESRGAVSPEPWATGDEGDVETRHASLAGRISNCCACFFRDPQFAPLAPARVKLPVVVMFIGENPSWEEGQRIPFDEGATSGRSLDDNYLRPLGLARDGVWFTDLIKCRYPKDVYHDKKRDEQRIQCEVVGACSRWLVEELRLARPKIVVSLSDQQVYRRLRKAFALTTPARFAEAAGRPHPVELGGVPVMLFPMVHPDIALPLGQSDAWKPVPRAKWAPIHWREHLPALRRLLEQV